MKIREVLEVLEAEGGNAASELGARWRDTRGFKFMQALQAAGVLLRGNVCECGELKGNHGGEQAMGGCKGSGCERYKPVKL